MQVVKSQLERDKNVIDLVKTMGDVYAFVDAIQSLPDKLKLLEEIIGNILNQTVECAIFIREYMGHGFGGECCKSLCARNSVADMFSRSTCEADVFW